MTAECLRVAKARVAELEAAIQVRDQEVVDARRDLAREQVKNAQFRQALELAHEYLTAVEGKGEGGTTLFDVAKCAVDLALGVRESKP